MIGDKSFFTSMEDYNGGVEMGVLPMLREEVRLLFLTVLISKESFMLKDLRLIS